MDSSNPLDTWLNYGIQNDMKCHESGKGTGNINGYL